MEAVRGMCRAPATAASPARAAGSYPDFAALLGRKAWLRLPAAVRERFSGDHAADERIVYTGTLHTVAATGLGRALAWFAKIFDTPVATHVGTDVPAVVSVYAQPEVHGIVWERVYHFSDRSPVTVRSTKCLDRSGRLIEALGGGLRMRLELTEKRGTLRFTSTGYCLELFGIAVPLPRWLPPGITHVIHTDLGNGRFRFTMYTEHPWFGQMFFQEGDFSQRLITNRKVAATSIAGPEIGAAAQEAQA